MFGFLPLKSSYGVFFKIGLILTLLLTKHAVLTASAQKYFGRFESLSIVLASSTSDLFFLSTHHFVEAFLVLRSYERFHILRKILQKEQFGILHHDHFLWRQ